MSKKADILVIDDERVIIDSIIKISGLEGWNVAPVENAASALGNFDLSSYRLIICDIMMPHVNGFQFLKELEIRKINTPVIMITGYTTVENAVKSLKQGAVDFLPKPFTVDELLSVVKRGLNYSDMLYKDNAQTVPDVFVGCPHNYHRLGWISWMNIDMEGAVLIGATHLFTKTIKELRQIELHETNGKLTQGIACAVFHSPDDLSYNLISPLSGKIIERNEKLFTDNKLIEKDPYFEGWLYKIIPVDVGYETGFLTSCSSDRI